MILQFKDKFPQTDKSIFISNSSIVIGDVTLGEDSSVWFNTVIRGDVNFIRIGDRTNVQDGSVLHVTHKKFPLIIGSDVTIGHNATVHGCTIKDRVLIGMGSVILDNVCVNTNSIIAAGSVVKENFVVPGGALIAGVPAKVVRDLSKEEIQKIKDSAANYVRYANEYRGIG
jgi:carbonic anhydrase/acetyltransferase-like protein (isoleucine patch superfamily)